MTVIQGVEVVEWENHRTVYGGPIRGSRRSIAFLRFLEQRLAEEHPDCRLVVIQSAFNVGVEASAGTHDLDAVYDVQIDGMAWGKAQSWLRRQGFLCWHRTPAQGFADHIHGIVAGYTTPVGVYVPGQVTDYYNHAFGLQDMHVPGSDASFHPDPQFVFDYPKWLQENTVTPEDLDKIDARVDRALAPVVRKLDTLLTRSERDAGRDVKLAAGLDALETAVADDATKTQIRNLRKLVADIQEPPA